MPNWELSDFVSGLIRWDYYNPAEDAEKDLEDGPEIEDAFDDDLAGEAANSPLSSSSRTRGHLLVMRTTA